MCFEASIYDCAADHLGDNYVKNHLEKLDVLSKWVIVLRLVAGYEFKKGQAPYSSLKRLIASRNKLVHSKSEPFDFRNQINQINKLLEEEKKTFLSIDNAYRALVLVSMELDIALGVINNPRPSFEPEVSLLYKPIGNIKSVLSECRAIISKTKQK